MRWASQIGLVLALVPGLAGAAGVVPAQAATPVTEQDVLDIFILRKRECSEKLWLRSYRLAPAPAPDDSPRGFPVLSGAAPRRGSALFTQAIHGVGLAGALPQQSLQSATTGQFNQGVSSLPAWPHKVLGACHNGVTSGRDNSDFTDRKSGLTMYLCKTDKAREELSSRSRALSQRERATLLMSDGTRTRSELRVMSQCDDALLDALIAGHYLRVMPHRPGGAPAKERSAHAAPAPELVPAPRAPTDRPPVAVATRNADNFDGKRSLATTRMFLFDIGERMFARHSPDQAVLFRDQLREAHDRDSMLSVARDIVTAVEEIAGHDRADSLSERIAMLLPPEG